MKVTEKIMLEGTKADLFEYFNEKFKSGEWGAIGNNADSTSILTIKKQLDKCQAIIQGEKGPLWGKVGQVFTINIKQTDPPSFPVKLHMTSVWVRIFSDYYWDMMKDSHEMGKFI